MPPPETALMDPAAIDPEPAAGAADAAEARVLAGDAEAFADLMALTERRVLTLAWRLLGDRDEAQDAAQEAFLRAFRSLRRFRLGESFPAWIAAITVNVCADLARKRPRAQEALVPEAAPAAAQAEETHLREEQRALVRRALAVLTPAERAALVLRDLEGHETGEAARILGVRPVTVRSQLCAARAKLQAFCAKALAKGGER